MNKRGVLWCHSLFCQRSLKQITHKLFCFLKQCLILWILLYIIIEMAWFIWLDWRLFIYSLNSRLYIVQTINYGPWVRISNIYFKTQVILLVSFLFVTSFIKYSYESLFALFMFICSDHTYIPNSYLCLFRDCYPRFFFFFFLF